MRGSLTIRGALVYDVRKGSFRRLNIVIDGGRIGSLEGSGTNRTRRVLNAEGLYVLPGLIDCHVHLTMRGEDADPGANAERSDRDIATHAASAAERTLFGGVTAVRDVGGWNYVEMALREDIERGRRAGPRLFLAGRLLSIPTPAARYYPGMYAVMRGPEEVRAAVLEQIAHGADLIKVMATGAMLSPEEEDAGQVQLSREETRAAVEAAEESGRHVAAHAHAVEGIRAAVEAGVASIEHGTFPDHEALELMASSRVFMVPTLSATLRAIRDEEVLSAMPAHLRRRYEGTDRIHLEAMRAAHRAAVPIAMGTDAGTPGNHHGDNAQECVHLVEEVGMTPQAAIAAATVNAARLLRQEANLGAIEPGMCADLVAYRADPLEDIAELTRPVLVVKNGRVQRDNLGLE